MTRRLLNRIQDDWQATRPDLDPTPMRRVILLARTAAHLMRCVAHTQQQHDLNGAQADLLFTLYRSAPPQGLTPSELASLSVITPASITNRLDSLERAGLIQRQPNPHDARSRRVQLTPQGRARIETLLPDHLRNETQLLAGLTDAEQAQLEALLLKLADHLETRP